MPSHAASHPPTPGSALLALSATSEPFGAWYLYNLNFDGLGTRLACPNGESLVADYPRLNFNQDALAVSLHTYCPSSGGAPGAPGAGAALMVLPKGAAVSGEPRIAAATFTSFEVASAASGSDLELARSIVQLEPVVPQAGEDVASGSMYFVANVSRLLIMGISSIWIVALNFTILVPL